MNWVGLALGFFGSAHCMFMCGPLMIGMSRINPDKSSVFWHALRYNAGRLFAYVVLGFVFSIVGQALSLVGLQRFTSIGAGLFLVGLVIYSLDVERFMFKFNAFKQVYQKYFKFLSGRIARLSRERPSVMGFLNGLLPCGMVYIAIIGAIGAPSILSSAWFMFSFGLGTLPMMLSIMLGAGWLDVLRSISIKRAIPYIQFCMGLYLIYRGMFVEFPIDLSFEMAVKNGPMCH